MLFFLVLEGCRPFCFSKIGALVFALTIVRIVHIIANCLAFCLAKTWRKRTLCVRVRIADIACNVFLYHILSFYERDILSRSRHNTIRLFFFCAYDGEHPVWFSKQGALVFALTHFVRMIVRIAHIIANCLAFCLRKNLAKANTLCSCPSKNGTLQVRYPIAIVACLRQPFAILFLRYQTQNFYPLKLGLLV